MNQQKKPICQSCGMPLDEKTTSKFDKPNSPNSGDTILNSKNIERHSKR